MYHKTRLHKTNIMRFVQAIMIFGMIGAGCQRSALFPENPTQVTMFQASHNVLQDSLLRTQNQVALKPVAETTYRPFYGKDSTLTAVPAFEMDVLPVTNQQFLRFVEVHPEWQKSHVKGLFADKTYLEHWQNDTAWKADVSPNSPVVNVSWFAAKAYCQCMDKRLPSLDEWEVAAMADATNRDARKKPENYKALLSWYEKPMPATLPNIGQTPANIWGIQDLHGLVWEWTSDFNSVMISGESRKDAKVDDRGLFCSGGSVGATDLMNYAAFMRYAFRGSLKARYALRNLGFRCARDSSSPAIATQNASKPL